MTWQSINQNPQFIISFTGFFCFTVSCETFFPELVTIKPDKKENIKAINYLEILPLLVGKIQKMQNEIDELKNKLQGQQEQRQNSTNSKE